MNFDEFNALPVNIKKELVSKLTIDECVCCGAPIVHGSLKHLTCRTRDGEEFYVCGTCANLVFDLNQYETNYVHEVGQHINEINKAKYGVSRFLESTASINPIRNLEGKQYLHRAMFRAFLAGYYQRKVEE